MRAMIKIAAATALLATVASGAFAQSAEFKKIHEGAQVAGICNGTLSQAQENKVGLIAAAAASDLTVGAILSAETKTRGDARVQAYSLGCKDAKNTAAIKYYTDTVK